MTTHVQAALATLEKHLCNAEGAVVIKGHVTIRPAIAKALVQLRIAANQESVNVQAMQLAAAEIRALRQRNEVLASKVEVMEFFALVLHTQPPQNSRGASGDLAFHLDQTVNAMQEQT